MIVPSALRKIQPFVFVAVRESQGLTLAAVGRADGN